jgi:hypothetical protein
MARRKKNFPDPTEIKIGKYTTQGTDAQDQLALWHNKIDKRKKGTDEATFRAIMAAILATRSYEGGFHLYKATAPEEIVTGYNAILRDLIGEVFIRHNGTDVYKIKDNCPKIQIVSTGEPDLKFQVKDKSLTITWLNAKDIEPEIIGLVARVKPLVVDLPLLDLEMAYQWCHLNIPITENNTADIPKGLPVRYRALEDIDPELLELGKVISEDLVDKLQHWFLKCGYLCLLVKTETGASLIVPENFGLNLGDFWADNTLYVYRQMKIPQFIPVMKSDRYFNQSLVGVGRNLSKERELAVAGLKAAQDHWKESNGKPNALVCN